MITIGIDPGIERVGVGVVESVNGKLRLLHSELIKTPATLPTSARLEIIYNKLNVIMSNYVIDYASVEEIFFAKNLKTAVVVAQARGVIMLSIQLKGVPLYEYTPLQVKQALVGYGRATKNQINSVLKMILKENITNQDDVADGIALAITHINSYRVIEKMKG